MEFHLDISGHCWTLRLSEVKTLIHWFQQAFSTCYLLYVVPKVSPIAELFVIRQCVIGQYFYYIPGSAMFIC